MRMLPLRLARWRTWIIDHAPLPFLTNSHELALAGALVVIGIGLVFQEAQPNSVESQVPHWMLITWAWSILLGGVATIWGVFSGKALLEWLGQTLTGHGCGFYALAVLTSVGLVKGGVIVAVFTMLALVSWWRAFKISMLPVVQARLARETTRLSLRLKDGLR